MSLLIISTPHQYIAVPSNSISKRSPRFQGHSMRFRRLSLPIFASPPLFFASRFRCFSLQVNATRSLSDALPLTSLPRSAVPSRFFAMLFPHFSALRPRTSWSRIAFPTLFCAPPVHLVSYPFNTVPQQSTLFLLTAFFAFARPWLASPLQSRALLFRFRAWRPLRLPCAS